MRLPDIKMPNTLKTDITILKALLSIVFFICFCHLVTAILNHLLTFCVAATIFILFNTFRRAQRLRHPNFLDIQPPRIQISAEREAEWRESRRGHFEQRFDADRMAQATRDDEYQRESERLWQDEQRRKIEEFRLHQRHICTRATTQVFEEWRRDCRTLLQTPELITSMPRLPHSPCPNDLCDTRAAQLGICSHLLKLLYKVSRLDEIEMKDELRLWLPNGARVNQVGESCRKQMLGMANEITQVLQEILKDL
ncbi:hypothetical protein AUEXF2481DRAFT_696946 [Aureobasidium subglaciale EXF-2481]|uniref:Uncharacterized protein n=1 Tax=Aureobasidium subglaciale (strain EXF-2481) TaxID=1043005 RepID=A0A074YMU0_AURSE|nr:uncharacterized protein AUEXF2481DRAFT_696946 [Aureobasidium subglaciale EXF-2481]KEQ95432.1 hypothetical protein AUEXF2481DRAFT_696946 [Aureobasidium subglaciale EXF-2481]